jgi:exodeoxyribonuclease VII large subunit
MPQEKYLLSELQQEIRSILEDSLEANYHLIAEVGSIQENRNGHAYLELIEKERETDRLKAKARANIWAYTYRMLKPYFQTVTGEELSEGMKVSLTVNVTFHAVYGISLNITDIDPEYTLGDIERKRLEVLRRLEEEGVINMNKETVLPAVTQNIALISSETAAGYEDFLNQLTNNVFGYRFNIELFPALMQGNQAPESIVKALDEINLRSEEFDAVVIVRGGGSKSDLACFDDYWTAVNIAQFPLPVITGIGHERDLSIADTVAYKKLKTPTAAAEYLINKLEDYEAQIDEHFEYFLQIINRRISEEKQMLENLSRNLSATAKGHIRNGLTAFDYAEEKLKTARKYFFKRAYRRLTEMGQTIEIRSKQKIHSKIQSFELTDYQLETAAHNYINRQKNILNTAEYRINAYDPKNILKLGYSYTKKDGKPVKDASRLKKGDELESYFYKGKTKSIVK